MAAATPIEFRAKPIVVASYPRSGTHLTIDGLRHFFVETYRKQRLREPVHDLYLNLDRLSATHPFQTDEDDLRKRFQSRPERIIVKTHCTIELDQVDEAHRPLARTIVDAADVVYVVRDVRPVLASYMALRPLKYADSPTTMAEFLRARLDGGLPPAMAWAMHVSGWLDRAGVHVIKFEEMRSDYAGAISRLGEALGLTHMTGKPIRTFPKPRIVLENRIRRVLGRQLSSSIDNLRMKIETPNWRQVMAPEDLALIREQAGAAMERLGYSW